MSWPPTCIRYICYLRLWKHVQTPRAHLAVSGDANQVVGVLGADHIHAVNWMLKGKQGEILFFCYDKIKWESTLWVVYCTVCAAADRGVLCTGVLLLLLLSHRTICPEYVPPTTTLGWNLANAADITADCPNLEKVENGKERTFSLSGDENKIDFYSAKAPSDVTWLHIQSIKKEMQLESDTFRA